ncbi:la-related protein 6B-like, partial [Stegodyphus dumicola]|uniref:la-related protein 6B-like n=1 Tax=Stegodyphus dumicola TaxID=202533 RepID=UPI0015AC9A83
CNLLLPPPELLFELVTGMPALPKECVEKNVEKDTSEEQKDKIEKLEKEIRRLRGALKDAMKTNSSLSNQLQQLKREQYSRSSRNKGFSRTPSDSTVDDMHRMHSPSGPSPQMEEYADTLRQIQRAATHRSGKREERRNRNNEGNGEWNDGYIRNGNGYQQHHHRHHHHHHHQAQKSPQQRQQQPRLPRLPLRNQQNYSHQQYEVQYRQRSSNTLPALKQPLVPVVDHRLDKPRKSRGPRPTKIADQVTNG